MTSSGVFVELDKAIHERTLFDCGESELNSFIKQQASRHMAAGISRTMVLPAKKSQNQKLLICAFYTVAPGAISRHQLPDALAKKLPNYPIPVFLLAQLAVHSKYHGTGLGKITLIKALEHLLMVNLYMRAYAVVVDCLTSQAESFYIKFGFEFLCEHNGRTRLFLPMKKVEALFKN